MTMMIQRMFSKNSGFEECDSEAMGEDYAPNRVFINRKKNVAVLVAERASASGLAAFGIRAINRLHSADRQKRLKQVYLAVGERLAHDDRQILSSCTTNQFLTAVYNTGARLRPGVGRRSDYWLVRPDWTFPDTYLKIDRDDAATRDLQYILEGV